MHTHGMAGTVYGVLRTYPSTRLLKCSSHVPPNPPTPRSDSVTALSQQHLVINWESQSYQANQQLHVMCTNSQVHKRSNMTTRYLSCLTSAIRSVHPICRFDYFLVCVKDVPYSRASVRRLPTFVMPCPTLQRFFEDSITDIIAFSTPSFRITWLRRAPVPNHLGADTPWLSSARKNSAGIVANVTPSDKNSQARVPWCPTLAAWLRCWLHP
ncbi:hypothetical protein CMEL01_06740 [Colletotrichum melonis]|uniref:Uncharacterized protein n=1 Tax=Colletotrichum melonis TaxID=1209925 RepID=A0AAI9U5R7_9PEZI|nr:hypothetical protein CMEL01_06740 [Colletotrichum melonis]